MGLLEDIEPVKREQTAIVSSLRLIKPFQFLLITFYVVSIASIGEEACMNLRISTANL